MVGKQSVIVASIGAGLLVLVGGLVVLRSAGAPSEESASGEGLGAVMPALCRARDAAASDPGEARRIFLDEAHGPLHVLADDVAERERDVAAELLEAKQTVEAALEEPSIDAASVERDLGSLIDATGVALRSIDVEVQACA